MPEEILFPRLRKRIREFLEPKSSSNPQRPKTFQYATLPKACICTECGYVLENPTQHCRFISCPECGARMWRKRA